MIAAVGVLSCLLPWWSFSFGFGSIGGGYSVNGLHEIGIIAFLGFIGAGVIPFVMGDKTKAYDGQEKTIAAACFAGAGGIALIQLLRTMSSLGFGIFLAIAAGVLGALLVWGTIKLPEQK